VNRTVVRCQGCRDPAVADGLLVTDVWESQEAIDRFLSERLGAVLAQVGLEGTPRILPVHQPHRRRVAVVCGRSVR
jgi:hypothetical protein